MKKTFLFLALSLLVNLAFAQQKDDKQLTAEFDKNAVGTIQNK